MSELEKQAKTIAEIVEEWHRKQFAINRAEPTYENDKRYFNEFANQKVIRLEVARSFAEQLEKDKNDALELSINLEARLEQARKLIEEFTVKRALEQNSPLCDFLEELNKALGGGGEK